MATRGGSLLFVSWLGGARRFAHGFDPWGVRETTLQVVRHCFRTSLSICLSNLADRAKLQAPGVKERKLAGWRLSRGKAWKGSFNVTGRKKRKKKKKKHAPQMEANTAMLEDALTMRPFSSCCI